MAGDAKRLALVPTGKGRELFVSLDTASAEQVAGLLKPLAEDEQSQPVGAMTQVQRLLGGHGAGTGLSSCAIQRPAIGAS